ncbi:MAG TPA: matrixin family metalloprotease [Polyangiaceae bacterium]|nr:matrixin family metalloprotease [Polyangiaceae bacterium]
MPADGCMTDAQNCLTVGMPLFWASSCVTVSVQAAGAPKQHIDYNTALGSVTRAFAAWTSASCGGAAPSISVAVNGPITCAASEYNSDRGNANIVVFREDSWPYVGGQDALGLTRLRFDPASGEIWDSDIEVNAVDEPFSVGDATPGAVDLDSLLTHEAGHLLGLAHNTQDQTATMYPGYQTGTISLRTLAKDDIAGVCAIYPPTRQASTSSCEPRHGYSDLCGADQPAPVTPADDQKTSGCSFSRTPRGTGLPVSALFGLAAIVLLKRKRR